MRSRWTRGLVWGIVVGVGVLALPAAASVDGHLAADQVTDATYRYFLGDRFGVPGILYTHVGDNRGVGALQHELAKQNIADHLTGYGLTVTLEPVVYQSVTYYNVVGTQWGTLFPDQEYVIGAHYDSVNNPGADDNASGVSLVLECARILSQHESDYTIRYIAFTREEQGLYGSNAYVAAHAGDDILGMISADMVAYDPNNANAARIYSRASDVAIRTALGAAIVEYGDGLTWMDAGWISASDHAPFDAAGYEACLLIEKDVWDNPYYHQPSDNVETVDNINYAYAVKMTRAVAGYLVDEAGVIMDEDYLDFVYPEGQPAYSYPLGGTRVRVEVVGVGGLVPLPGSGLLHYNTGSGWQTEPLEIISDNVYDAVLPAAACGSTVQYYVSAQATTAEVFTDPRDAPAAAFSTLAAYGRTAVYSNAFDSNPGWTTQGQWAFGTPAGLGGAWGEPDPTSGYTGLYVYGYNLNGDYPDGMPEYHLTSTAINCTGQYGVQLRFWRWLGVETPTYDHAYVRVSSNGTSWTTIWQNTATMLGGDWVEQVLDISAVADNQPTVYLRWTMGTSDGYEHFCGWNVDDVEVTALDCIGPDGACCDPDGTCAMLSQGDCTGVWLGPAVTCDPNPCPQPWCLGDMNCSGGSPTFEDIKYFSAAVGSESGWWAYYRAMNGGADPICPWLLGDYSTPRDGVEFTDIKPFAASIGQPCQTYVP